LRYESVLNFFTKEGTWDDRERERVNEDKDLDIIVELSVLECYAMYLDENNPNKVQALGLVGEGLGILREAGPDPSFLPYSHAALLDADVRTQLMDRMNIIMGDLRDLNLDNHPLILEDDDFMEILINGVKKFRYLLPVLYFKDSSI
jgi:hypothetical protein